MTAEQLKDVERSALNVLRRHPVDMPVNVVQVARALGIRVLVTTFRGDKNLAGMIEKRKDQGTIWVNELDARVRQRFTVAHELGHWILGDLASTGTWEEPEQAVAYRLEESLGSFPERRANAFAAAMLMPAPWVNAWIEHGVRSPETLAELFEVSQQAMEIRLKTLGRLSGAGVSTRG